MSTYTPGPWVTYAHTKGIDILVDDGADGKGIATAQNKDDANLISAAPELLELARQIVLAADDNEGDIPGDIVAGARAAVHKATGGEL